MVIDKPLEFEGFRNTQEFYIRSTYGRNQRTMDNAWH